METRHTYGHHVHQRGAAGGAAGTTRDRHANTTTRAVTMITLARRSRARVFGAQRAASTCHQLPAEHLRREKNGEKTEMDQFVPYGHLD